MTGTLLEAPEGKKRVRVKVGEGEVLATVANLVGLARGRTAPSPPALSSSSFRRFSSGGGLGLDEQTAVDVRGKTADEALDDVVAALDRATLAATPFLRIIHGHVSCCRFQRHRVQCIDETGGGAWSDERVRKSSSWRPCG